MDKKNETDLVTLDGFFTMQRYLQGQSLREVEIRLGFHMGRLSQGAWFVTPIQILRPEEFELAGYSQVAGHHTIEKYGDINAASTQSEKQLLLKRKIATIAQWELHGSSRLIKVLPMIANNPNMKDKDQYPPGSGIPQWKITRPITCRGICIVKKYPGERFIPNQ